MYLNRKKIYKKTIINIKKDKRAHTYIIQLNEKLQLFNNPLSTLKKFKTVKNIKNPPVTKG